MGMVVAHGVQPQAGDARAVRVEAGIGVEDVRELGGGDAQIASGTAEQRERQLIEASVDGGGVHVAELRGEGEQEIGNWRSRRQDQRQHMGRASEHMEVCGSDVEHIGTVDKVRGEKDAIEHVRDLLLTGRHATEDDLKGYVKKNLARYKVPREIVFIDELPRNATGKVLKRELKDEEEEPAAK